MRFSLSIAAAVVGLFSAVTAKQTIKKRPDSDWDFILKGSDLHAQLTARDASKADAPPAYLKDYQMRARMVKDPSSLGVDSVKQISGYLDSNNDGKHLFFWFFESRNDPSKDPVMLWMNGGPGCSSMTGLFEELGPARISRSDLTPVRNPYSWNNNASVIFLDQPVGTGYSYTDGDRPKSSVTAAKDVYALLSLFFQQFPAYAKQDFHISGESYAGHYIPATGAEILSHSSRNINLKSLLIGNGLTDPYTQYAYYRPMACGDGGWPAALNSTTCNQMDQALPTCQKKIKACYDTDNDNTCVDATSNCNRAMFSNGYAKSGRSNYDVRANPPAHQPSYALDFLQSDKTVNAVGAESQYDDCSSTVYSDFVNGGDWMRPLHKKVPGILDQIPVLVYAGDADFICNWLGNQAWTNALDWKGKAAFSKAAMTPVKSGSGREWGQVKHSSGLAFARVYAASHFVPEDQPEGSLDMVNRWISGQWHQ